MAIRRSDPKKRAGHWLLAAGLAAPLMISLMDAPAAEPSETGAAASGGVASEAAAGNTGGLGGGSTGVDGGAVAESASGGAAGNPSQTGIDASGGIAGGNPPSVSEGFGLARAAGASSSGLGQALQSASPESAVQTISEALNSGAFTPVSADEEAAALASGFNAQ